MATHARASVVGATRKDAPLAASGHEPPPDSEHAGGDGRQEDGEPPLAASGHEPPPDSEDAGGDGRQEDGKEPVQRDAERAQLRPHGHAGHVRNRAHHQVACAAARAQTPSPCF